MNGTVKTSELVQEFSVSSETIRRYLEELECDNKLRRVYGGAVKVSAGLEEPSFVKREVLYAEEKKRIGRAAAAMVRDHDVIVLDDGTTTLQLIPFLEDKKNLVLITASVPILSSLLQYGNQNRLSGDIYFLGGKINLKHLRIAGVLAEEMMENFCPNKAFIAVDGILVDKGITSFDDDRALLARRFIAQSEQTIVLTDHSKLGVGNFFRIADFQDIDRIICDQPAPKEWKKTLEASGVKWFVAD